MLYLNRRGTARLAVCQDCGWQATCPNCDLTLVYHGDAHHLLCHACGHRQSAPSVCPVCQSQAVVFKTAGTKAIESEVRRLFPEARVARYDTDNNSADSLVKNYQAIKDGNVDIIIGTQLIAKGLDLPNLTTLGIILADSSLTIPDFTAQERTYQLIRQVIGRVGRGHQAAGEVVLQTYQPNNATLNAAVNGEWKRFYEGELAERRRFNFPPFCHLLTIVARRASSASASRACQQLADRLQQQLPELTIEGPAPAFHEHAGGKYNWQLVVKASRRQSLLEAIKQIPAGNWSYDIDPVNLL
jgi:primosomal protein N' (replication factor Y)